MNLTNLHKYRKNILKLCQKILVHLIGVPLQPTKQFIWTLYSWHKIKSHICPNRYLPHGMVDLGNWQGWRQKKSNQSRRFRPNQTKALKFKKCK
jgi:hypothetical protein